MRLQRLALVAGLGLFLFLLHRIGLAAVGRSLAQIGWGFAAILALEAVVVLLATLGWRQTLPPDHRVPFGSLLAMRLSGDGVNALAPAAVVGGELVRAGLLARLLPGAQALGSVGLAAMAQFLAQGLFVGLGATVIRADGLQPRLRLLGLTVLALLLLFVAVLARLSRQRKIPSGRLEAFLERAAGLFRKRAPHRSFWQDLDRQVFGAMRERPGRLALAVALFFGGWMISIAEVSLVLAFLGAPVPAGTAISIAVLEVLVEGVFFFVPARLGVQEGGLYAIFLALGLDPARGFTLGLVRRLRELAWGLAGLAVLGLHRVRSDGSGAVAQAPSVEAYEQESSGK